MPRKTVVCPECGASVPNGRLACPACGSLVAAVAGSAPRRRESAQTAGQHAPPADAGSRSEVAAPVNPPAKPVSAPESAPASAPGSAPTPPFAAQQVAPTPPFAAQQVAPSLRVTSAPPPI